MSFDRVFEETRDPWESESSEREARRFAVTLSLLESTGRGRFNRAVEIGCAEGVFTERLAPLCDSLTALDFSRVALKRASKRLAAWPGVQLVQWDMRTEPLPGRYDLVVAMGVITSMYRPAQVRRVVRDVISAIEPGGFLLFSDVRQSRVFESAWWGRYVLRGGEQIRRLVSASAELETIAEDDTDSHVFGVYRRL
jgi:2-polyprenyl-3-methyl-5-hydroxy-6-metoxy-1,4-benzoquinol methylase